MRDGQQYDPLLHPFAGNVLEMLPPNLMESWVERSALIEYEAGTQPRALAEALALIELLCQNPAILTGVTVLQLELAGSNEWLLTTDLEFARRHLAEIGGIETAILSLADVVERQYGGVAMLNSLG